jgi:asparagine synthase (glutamine-hydrolysing)
MPKRGFSFPLHDFIKSESKVRDFIIENLESLKKGTFSRLKLSMNGGKIRITFMIV